MNTDNYKDVYCLRHTIPDIKLIYAYGQTDIDVAESFETEAARCRSVLPEDISAYTVISSPLQRCYKLARYLSDEVQTDERLKEVSFGEWEMRPWEEIEQAEGYRAWRQDFVNRSAPGGESFRQMAERVMACYRDTLEKPGDRFILVSHGGAIRALIAGLTGLPLANLFQINIDFGGVTLIRAYTSKPHKIIYINR
ncbi:MAG: alpha-ribazole phosphatase [Calditrichaeota bacterium]|nr:MAG: alpha-ribazole phosphatase [Calditrichota bacterium]